MRPRGVRALGVTDIQGYLEFTTERRKEQQESKDGIGNTVSRETTFQESIQLEADGFFYHPNLLEFTAAGLFGLLQHEYEELAPGFGQSGRDTGPVIEYDVTANILQHKPYPGMIFARREEGLEPRLFRSSVDTTIKEYGVHWQYLSERIPTRIQFTDTDIFLDPLETDEENTERTDRNLRFETAYVFSEHNKLELLYEREKVRERPNVFDYDTDEVTLAHRWEFGRDYRQRLDSELNYYRQVGSFDIERLRWRENLWLEHSDTLRSYYRFEALDRTRGSLVGLPTTEERSYSASGTLEHRLYDSLVSQLSGFGHFQDFDTGARVNRYGVDASFDYRKTNPWGTLHATYRASYERESRSGGNVYGEARDEQHTFRDPSPVTLTNPTIQTGSIVITALDRITYYQLGRDYRIYDRGDRIEIERVLTGRIADGETVLIDYVFNIGGDFDLDTITQNLVIRQDFDFGFSPYYRLRWQNQALSPREAAGAIPEDITAHTLGAEFRLGNFKLGGEYEHHDSTINPFEALRFNGGYSRRFASGVEASLRAGWSEISYGYPRDRDTRYVSIEGRYRHPLARGLTFEGAAIYRDGRDTLNGPNRGLDLDLSLEWLIRQTELRVTYEFGRIDDDFARNESSAIFVQLRRRF